MKGWIYALTNKSIPGLVKCNLAAPKDINNAKIEIEVHIFSLNFA